MVSDLTHHRARVAALARHGAPDEVRVAACVDLAAAKVRRLAAEESIRQGRPVPASDSEVIGFVASVLMREAA